MHDFRASFAAAHARARAAARFHSVPQVRACTAFGARPRVPLPAAAGAKKNYCRGRVELALENGGAVHYGIVLTDCLASLDHGRCSTAGGRVVATAAAFGT
eukprot:COSAG02_NODE_7348_length_3053_cov_3.965132_5_plen_101_part_00